jgi:hypothetical protein
MKNTSSIYKGIDYLKQRFLLDRISLGWRDRESLNNIVQYVQELEFKQEVDNKYIIRSMTWTFLQVLTLKMQDRELSPLLVREVLWKMEEILNTPVSRWKNELAIELMGLKEDSSSIKAKVNDMDNLVRDVIRFNTRSNAVSG